MNFCSGSKLAEVLVDPTNGRMILWLFLLLLARTLALGDVSAVYALIERVRPAASAHFDLALAPFAAGPRFHVSSLPDGRIHVAGSSVSELAAGVGVYLREYCNWTLGWPRGGGSWLPPKLAPAEEAWPPVDPPLTRARVVPWSYFTNVVTHSYSLAWYSWRDWSAFIDWMALSGINMFLAMTVRARQCVSMGGMPRG